MVTITERFRNDTTTVYSEDAELVWERIFDAPRDVVWQAFMDPERIPLWWGPHGSSATVVEMDVRPGGTWRFISRAPGREDVPFTGEYLELDPPASFRQTFIVDVDGMRDQVGIEHDVDRTVGGVEVERIALALLEHLLRLGVARHWFQSSPGSRLRQKRATRSIASSTSCRSHVSDGECM